MICSAEIGEIVEGGLAISDDSSAGRQHCTHPSDVPGLFAFAAIFRMGDWDEVVDEIDRPDIGAANPGSEARIIETRVPDIEIKTVLPGKLSPRGRSQDAFDYPASNARPRFG